MFKLTLKLLALTILLTAGLFFVSGNRVSALSNNCPWAPGGNWGNAGQGGGSGLMGSLMVHAIDMSSGGSPLNVNYVLNSDLPGNSNPDLDKRIFQWPVGTGRDSQHTFTTGEHLGNGAGGYDCNGWSVLGPGTANNVGNGWVVDCGGANLGEGTSRFWISHVENPGGQQGKWKLILNDGGAESVLSSDLNNDAPYKLSVINGGNIRLRLEWTPKPQPPQPPPGRCNFLDVYNEGTYTNAGGDHPTRAHVQVSGVTGVSVNGGGADWSQHGIDGNAPDDNGAFTYKDKVWRYTAEQPNITITVTKESYYGSGVNLGWHTIAGGWSQTINCISVSCSITSVVDYNGRPGGIIVGGDQVVVYGSITNTSPADGPNLNWPYLTGTGGNSNGAGVLGSGGDTGYVSLTITAPRPAQNWTLSYSVAGVPATATCPPVTVPVYEHFSSTLGALSDLIPTDENPSSDNYNTTVNISETSHPVNIPTNSAFYKSPAGGGKIPIASNSGGTYTAPTSTAFSGSYSIPPGSFSAGDEYCASIHADYTSGYVGPDNNVLYGVGPADAVSCPRIANKPYFKVYNSSISAMNGINDPSGACSATALNSGLLAGWNDNFDGPNTDRGAGSQLSALALIKITGVASAQTDIARPPTDLTFANTVPADISTARESPSLGGNFGGTPSCVPAPVAAPGALNLAGNPANLPGSGSYQHTGNVRLNGGTINGATAIFVKGDVYIKNSITYNPAAWSPGNVPSFVLVATGNIYIDPSVTQLDGVYVAQPSNASTGGTIYTCAAAAGPTTYNVYSDYAGCHNQLMVNGSFNSSKVKLLRTFGSLRDETPTPGSPGGSQVGFCWTSAGPCAGMRCTQINEPSDPDTWNDNYLCVPNSSGVHLAWTHWENSPYNDPRKDPAKNDPGDLNLGYLRTHGYPFCTKWDVPPDYAQTWSDNWLCSDQNVGMNFRLANDASQYCTMILEVADRDGNWANPGYFLCEPKAAPATPPVSGAPFLHCSNAGTQITTATCAAEVFRFSPELYLTDPATQPPSQGATQYDAITSLPPVL